MMIGSLCLIPIKIRQKVNVHGAIAVGVDVSGGRGTGRSVAAADYPPIRHKNNFLIYEESLKAATGRRVRPSADRALQTAA